MFIVIISLSKKDVRFLDDLLISSAQASKEKREYFQSGQWLNNEKLS